MKKSIITPALSAILALGFMSSCVSTKKYEAALAENRSLVVLQDELNRQKLELESERAKLREDRDRLTQEKEDLAKEKASTEASLRTNLSNKSEQVNQLTTDLQAREARLKEMERILAEKDRAVNALRKTVGDALLGFKASDLTIDVRNGKVYVSLSNQLLFKSGSTKVDAKGQEALKKLASVLQNQPDVNVVVEGHTDDVPIAKGTAGMQDNWDLSVMRATEITRILTDAGVAPQRVTPSGRSKYVPVDPGTSADARQKNRRTEIILTPKLDELFQILEQN
ncbi:cell envelope biogenesis protein OmpA [Rufibacter sp. DG15C]|uniref:OmpA/MotB family protein n=1 Tax=Rufibacter sp. DG15C TaxID=1379909 RepID=UPI00078E886C|nr:OmpA family protein [Rufibacter sp. DG15C]AMM50106.1 cell envelope biogenesis protein OmpA [Rufibacter sp. DG15C]